MCLVMVVVMDMPIRDGEHDRWCEVMWGVIVAVVILMIQLSMMARGIHGLGNTWLWVRWCTVVALVMLIMIVMRLRVRVIMNYVQVGD